MTGSVALDVVIGLVFVYSLYSLLTTTVVEMIASVIRLRSTFLERGIKRMLNDENGKTEAEKTDLAKKFYEQPLIKYLGSNSFFGLIKKPSYLSAQNFTKALLEIMKAAGESENKNLSIPEKIKKGLGSNVLGTGDTKQFLASLMEDAQDDIEKFKILLEKWYDDTMERVTSWYKKQIQLITFVIGFFVAMIFNVDTPKIVSKLSHDPEARAQYIELAGKLVENKEFANRVYGDSTSQNYDTLRSSVTDLRKQALEAKAVLSITDEWDVWSFPGWLITAVALSLGAPFWFDLLNKLMKLRSSVREAQSPASKSTAPPALQINRVG
ncbi:MAG TPA: hypothetical protein VGK59_09605 [Ohtaekwangia sp.]